MLMRGARSVGELVEEQCLLWEHRKPAQIAAEAASPVIAISRQAGTFARESARDLADKRRMSLYDSNLIHEVARVSHYADRVVRTLDERGRSYLDDLLSSMEGEGSLVGDEYFAGLSRVINAIGRHGNAIILGRGAARILHHHNVLRVRFVAPEPFRIEQTRRERGLSTDQARQRVRTVDAERKAFLHHYLGVDDDDPEFYDLTINSAHFDTDDSVALIDAALEQHHQRR